MDCLELLDELKSIFYTSPFEKIYIYCLLKKIKNAFKESKKHFWQKFKFFLT
jgi:hypothetical protein